jgi:hypothetical protein
MSRYQWLLVALLSANFGVASLMGLVLPLMACIGVGAALSGVFPLAMATIPSEIVGPTRTAGALSADFSCSPSWGQRRRECIMGIIT